MFPHGIVIEPVNRQYRTSKVNQVFSLISSISKDKGDKVKDSSTLNEDESCLVAGAGLSSSFQSVDGPKFGECILAKPDG